MNFRINHFVILIASCSLLLTSCKDDKDDDPAPLPTSVLCDGKGSLSFMPLSLGNKWTLTATGNTVSLEVIDTLMQSGIIKYNVSSSLGGAATYSQYPNGDVKRYEFSSGDDVLYLPFNPVAGQTWNCQVDNFTSRKVVSINETVVTAACTYTGCVMIQSFQTTTLKRTEYFKRGVGLVSSDMVAPGVITKLAAVKLN